MGISATNAELMAAAPAPAAVTFEARSSRSGKATDIPLDRIAASLPPDVIPDQVSHDGLRVDLAFVGAAGQGVPDTMGAVGPTQYLVVLNSVVRSFNKTTGLQDGVLDLGLSTFFNPVRGQDGAFDPKVRYDRLSGRWFVLALTKRVMLAVSSSGVLTPQTGWTFYAFAPDQVNPVVSTGCAPDYPRMATDAHAIYVVTEMLCPATLQTLFVIRKSSVLGGGPMVVTAFRNQSLGFGTPVDNFDPHATTGYVMTAAVRVDTDGDTGRSYFRVSDPGGTPVLSAHIEYFSKTNGTGVYWPVRHRGNNLESGVPDNYTGRMFLANGYSHSVPLRHGRLWVADLVGVDNTGRSIPVTT